MPPRKSEPRRSDTSQVSLSRFAPMNPDSTMELDTHAPASAPAPAPAPALPESVETSPRPVSAKDKDKDKEREKEKREDAVTIEDLSLPKSIITRLAKGVLPPNTQIQANAILALSKSATVFVSHLANAANEYTVSSNKKTIMPDDVLRAIDETEFGFMRPKLEAEFQKFFSTQSTKRSTYRRKVAAAKKAGDTSMDVSMVSTGSNLAGETEPSMLDASTVDDGAQPKAKKAKTGDSAADPEHLEDASDPDETQAEEEEEEEEAEEEGADEDGDEEEDAEEEQDADKLEDRQHPDDDGDEALDDDGSD